MNEPMYLIWSEEHGAWWQRHASGYTYSITEAGRYAKAAADLIVVEANRHIEPGTGRRFNEIAIPDPL